MKKYAFTLIEQVLVLAILGIFAVTVYSAVRPNEMREENLRKVSKSMHIQVEFASKSILAKNTKNYILTRMYDSSGEFSIASASSQNRMLALYKKNLIGKRDTSLSDAYKTAVLTDGVNSITGVSVSSFAGYSLKNDAYFGLKLHGNCTTTYNKIYDPSTPEKTSRENTCGIIFYDINGQKEPNKLGVDQYIVALGKRGVK